MAEGTGESNKDQRKVPAWFPTRLDWYPGESQERAKFQIREAGRPDVMQLSRFMKVKPWKILNWVTQHGYSVWIVCRNGRNALAAIVVRHGPEESTVLKFYCHPDLELQKFLPMLTVLIACEMPEYPMLWKFMLTDANLTRYLRANGWAVEESDDTAGTITLRKAPALGQ